MLLTTALVAAMAPCMAQAFLYVSWSFANLPAEGIKDVTFPINIAHAPHKSGYYFAQQFKFGGMDNVSYTGIQPRPDQGRRSIVHAVFSSFQPGAKSSHPNCYDGADTWAGVSCAVEFHGNYTHTWNLNVYNVGRATWRGDIIDTVTRERHVIGNWTLPGDGLIQSSQIGFVEYYPNQRACSEYPYVDVTFFNPFTTSAGASTGTLDDTFENGECSGQENLQTKQVHGGQNIRYGHARKHAS